MSNTRPLRARANGRETIRAISRLTPATVLMPGHISLSLGLSGPRTIMSALPSTLLDLSWSRFPLCPPTPSTPALSVSNPNTPASCALALIQPIMRDRRGITVFYCELGRLTAVLWLIIRVFNCSWGDGTGAPYWEIIRAHGGGGEEKKKSAFASCIDVCDCVRVPPQTIRQPCTHTVYNLFTHFLTLSAAASSSSFFFLGGVGG